MKNTEGKRIQITIDAPHDETDHHPEALMSWSDQAHVHNKRREVSHHGMAEDRDDG
jgi:hypothetical protein